MFPRGGPGLGGVGEFVIREALVCGHFTEKALRLRALEGLRLVTRLDFLRQGSMPCGHGPHAIGVVTEPPCPGHGARPGSRYRSYFCCHVVILLRFDDRISDPDTENRSCN